MVNRIKPTREITGSIHEDYHETHPAYAMIGASRVSGRASLFGSDFLHQHYVTISIHTASLRRSLANDWIHAEKQVIEVAVSEAQWATFVSSMNVGHGVPATLQWREGQGDVARIDPDLSRREQFRGEVEDRLKDALAAIEELKQDIEAGAGKKVLREKVERAERQLGSNVGFVAEQFDEHMEKTVEKAKIEINAYATQMMIEEGRAALADRGTSAISLPDTTS